MEAEYYFINRETQPEKWVEIWSALTAILAGGGIGEIKITEKEITIFCKGYAYEGTDPERGHCFTKRERSGRKHAIWIEDK